MGNRDENNELYGGLGRADSAYWETKRRKIQPTVAPISEEERVARQNSELLRLVDELGIDVKTALANTNLKRSIFERIYDVSLREVSDLEVGRRVRGKYEAASEDDAVPF
jgi:predicted DNA-binding protein (UPF0251 family)